MPGICVLFQAWCFLSTSVLGVNETDDTVEITAELADTEFIIRLSTFGRVPTFP